MACNSCEAPQSVTNVYNSTVAASQFGMETLIVSVGLTVTTAVLPASGGFFLLFLDGAPQEYGVDYTVDFATGIVTLVGATQGQKASVVYIIA